MQPHSFDNIIISDTSCLIALTHIRQIDLLKKLYSKITITPEIKNEYKEPLPLPDWIEIREVENKKLVNAINQHLDIGESSAIALASETKNSLLIIDEDKGRKYALNVGLPVIGTIGVLRQAYERGFIDSPEKVTSLMNELKENNHFRISDKIIENVKSQLKLPKNNRRNEPEIGR